VPRFVVQHHAVLASTMDVVRAGARQGAPDGTVVVAGRQTQGRGRHGRDWFSPEGNLYASILLRPGLPPGRLSELGFIVALAVADAVDAALPGGRTRLKWPNDVLVDGAKVAGILIEIVEDNVAVIGIGLNISRVPEAAPYPITCLRDAGADTSPDAVLTHLLAALEMHLAHWAEHGFAQIRAAWLARGPAPGDTISVRVGTRIDTGQFAGLDVDGTLLLADGGSLRRVLAGEVIAMPTFTSPALAGLGREERTKVAEHSRRG
jgi:BirA family transcriptional regulator, biotin operon repressor / biotin---[acetyl-CoA-carboxylase] ligase